MPVTSSTRAANHWFLPAYLLLVGLVVAAGTWKIASLHAASENVQRLEEDLGPASIVLENRLTDLLAELDEAASAWEDGAPTQDSFAAHFDALFDRTQSSGIAAVAFVEIVSADLTEVLARDEDQNIDYTNVLAASSTDPASLSKTTDSEQRWLLTRLASGKRPRVVVLDVGREFRTRSPLVAAKDGERTPPNAGQADRLTVVPLEELAQPGHPLLGSSGTATFLFARAEREPLRGEVIGWSVVAVDPGALLSNLPAPRGVALELRADNRVIGHNTAPRSGTTSARRGVYVPRVSVAFELSATGSTTYQPSQLPMLGVMFALALTLVSVATAFAINTTRRSTAAVADELAQNEHQATHDGLTGLANRRAFQSHLSRELVAPAGREGLALAFFDLDRFKLVNDNLGHVVGDELLCAVADRLAEVGPWATNDGLVARWSGDEFAGLWRPRDRASAMAELNRLVAAFHEPVRLLSGELRVGISCGLAFAVATDEVPEALVRRADAAMYAAKRQGGLRVIVHDVSLAAITERVDLERALRRALAAGAVTLRATPVVDRARSLKAVEVHLGWSSPAGELAGGALTTLAEELGLGDELADRLVRDACRYLKRWAGATGDAPDFVRVRLSEQQTLNPGLSASVLRWLDITGAEATRLHFGLPEALLVRRPPALSASLKELQGTGAIIVVVDYGAYHGPLAPLRDLPISRLNLDSHFVDGVEHDPRVRSAIAAAVTWSRHSGTTVSASGIASDSHVMSLSELGVSLFEGSWAGDARPAGQIWHHQTRHRPS